MMENDDLVTLTHGTTLWLVRESTLRNCSAVLDSMLRDSDHTQPRIMHLNDVDENCVDAFVRVAKLSSYDSRDGFPSVDTLSKLTVDAMPLVHKYDCTSLLQMLKFVQQKKPDAQGIIAIVNHEPESIAWINDDSMLLCLLKSIFHDKYDGILSERLANVADWPPALLTKLLSYTMFDLNLRDLEMLRAPFASLALECSDVLSDPRARARRSGNHG